MSTKKQLWARVQVCSDYGDPFILDELYQNVGGMYRNHKLMDSNASADLWNNSTKCMNEKHKYEFTSEGYFVFKYDTTCHGSPEKENSDSEFSCAVEDDNPLPPP